MSKADITDVSAGTVFEFDYPFIRDVVTLWDGSSITWRPGVRDEMIYPDDAEQVFDALGKQIITVIDLYKPGRFPTRVFYTRAWCNPDGTIFGKASVLRIKTISAFRNLIKGYRHDVRLATSAERERHLACLRKQMQRDAA